MLGQTPNSGPPEGAGPPEGRVGDSSGLALLTGGQCHDLLGEVTELPQCSPVMAGQSHDLQPQGLDTGEPQCPPPPV